MYRNGNSCAYLGHRCHCLVRSASLSFATGTGRLSPRWGVPLILIGASPAPIAVSSEPSAAQLGEELVRKRSFSTALVGSIQWRDGLRRQIGNYSGEASRATGYFR